jgi:hypothetical protein
LFGIIYINIFYIDLVKLRLFGCSIALFLNGGVFARYKIVGNQSDDWAVEMCPVDDDGLMAHIWPQRAGRARLCWRQLREYED